MKCSLCRLCKKHKKKKVGYVLKTTKNKNVILSMDPNISKKWREYGTQLQTP